MVLVFQILGELFLNAWFVLKGDILENGPQLGDVMDLKGVGVQVHCELRILQILGVNLLIKIYKSPLNRYKLKISFIV